VEQLIQVSYDITNPKTLKREIDALLEDSTELVCNNLLLITWDKEEILKYNKLEIRLLPARKWLCGTVNNPISVH
jgi:predicted AAA+ superfamily ATPase